jgi:hypothetical protein
VESPLDGWLGEAGVIFEHPAPAMAAVMKHTNIERMIVVNSNM